MYGSREMVRDRWTDGRTDGQKKWQIEVGAHLKNELSLTLLYNLMNHWQLMFLDTASKQFHADDHSKCVQIHKYQCSTPTTYIKPDVLIDAIRVKTNF